MNEERSYVEYCVGYIWLSRGRDTRLIQPRFSFRLGELTISAFYIINLSNSNICS